MMPYIPFTDEQKLQAGQVDLPAFLTKQGVALERSGPEYRLEADPYITIRGNRWFDHAEQRGGNAITFAKRFYGLSYPEAMQLLLDGEGSEQPTLVTERKPTVRERKPFSLPPRHPNMRWTMSYLAKHRHIPHDILSHFITTGLLYEGAEPSKDGTKVYRNAIFVGKDRDGVPRHAYRHGLGSTGKNIKGNIESSNPAYSFQHIGTSGILYVFEAPIDMLSFIALHPDGWQQHSYVALCGISKHAMLQCLADNPNIKQIFLCLDNDERGISGTLRLLKTLWEKSDCETFVYLPENNDWNDDQKQACMHILEPSAFAMGMAMG